MKILGIESSSMVASVALVAGGITMAEYTLNFKKTHSQTLLPMIDEVMRMLEFELSEVDAIAVSGGPGSFTGLRIGSATAKGLGLALDKPLIHVPTLDAMAYGLFGSTSLVCPMMDARRNQVYTGLYYCEKHLEVLEPSYFADVRELAELLNERGESVILLGDGVPVHQKFLREHLKVSCQFAPAHLNRQRAAAVAALGAIYLSEGKTETAMEHRPNYLKKAQAERELEEARRQGKVKELAAGHSVGIGEEKSVYQVGKRHLVEEEMDQ